MQSEATDDDYSYIDVDDGEHCSTNVDVGEYVNTNVNGVIREDSHKYEDLKHKPDPSGLGNPEPNNNSRRHQPTPVHTVPPPKVSNSYCRRPPCWGWAVLIIGLVTVGTVGTVLFVTSVNKQCSAYEDLLKRHQEDPELKQKWAEHAKKFFVHGKQSKNEGIPYFKCNTSKSSDIPTSVDKLRPGDINIVGAMGDSITAGFGILAVTIIDALIQDRGHSYSIGGYDTLSGGVITIPNILKNYNNALYGYSTADGGIDSEEAQFNVAEGGATARDLPEQADSLIQRMQDDDNVDMNKDWKMVTIFIGGNDLCRVCYDYEGLGSDAHLRNMESTLDKMAAGMPRTVVNVMPIMDITPVPGISTDIICDSIQAAVCPCAVDSQYHDELKREQAAYSSKVASLVGSGKYDKDEFTVVFQPFLRDTKPPKDENGDSDVSYFSPDCFHFSEKGHQGLARNMWNSLFIPVGQKPTSVNFKEDIQCPPVGAYITTNKNSASAAHKPSNIETISDIFVDVRPESATPGGWVRSLTLGLAVVSSICGILLILVVAALMVVVIKRRREDSNLNPIQMS